MDNWDKTAESIARAEHISPDKNGENIEAKRVAGYVFNPTTLEWQRDTNTNVITFEQVFKVLQEIRDSISMPVDYNETVNGKQTYPVGGTIGTVTTVTTAATLTNQTNIGGSSADMMTENTSYQDWGLSIRSNII